METVFTYIGYFLAVYGMIRLVNDFKIAKIIYTIFVMAIVISYGTQLFVNGWNGWSGFVVAWLGLVCINELLSFKGWSTPTVAMEEEYIKREIEDEKRWNDMINGDWFKNFCKNLNTIIDAE